jgi:hypothetical protein
VFCTLLLSACAHKALAADAELGRIKSVGDFGVAAADLKAFVERRLQQRESLRRDFKEAGFARSLYGDGVDGRCESFRWEGRRSRSRVFMTADICDGAVTAGAGVKAPGRE